MLNIDEVITKNEQSAIKEFIECYASGFDRYRPLKAPLSHILRFWGRNKENLYNLFGKQLILSKPFCTAKPKSEIEDNMRNVIRAHYEFRRAFREQIIKIFNVVNMANDSIYFLADFCDNACLLVKNESCIAIDVPMPDGKVYKIKPETKRTKAIGKICQAYGIEGFEEFRLDHSRVLNDKAMSGTLSLSIHPMDYLTMSENNCSWHSCMSWTEGKDYRQGTVEMMNSDYVIVAYFHSDDFAVTENYAWNNKKWRKLFIVHPNFISGIRGYPREINEFDEEVIGWLRELAKENFNREYEEEITWCQGEDGCGFFWGDEYSSIFVNTETNYMYNDYYYQHPTVRAIDFEFEDQDCYNYSGESECVICGDEVWGDEFQPCQVCCDECESIAYCAKCGDPFPYEDKIEINDDYFCSCCVDDYMVSDPITGEATMPGFGTSVGVARVTDNRVLVGMQEYCKSMIFSANTPIQEIRKKFPSLFKATRRSNWWNPEKYYVNIDEVDQGIIERYFGFDDMENFLKDGDWYPLVRTN